MTVDRPAAERLSRALAGRYQIDGEHGAGGMATVYRAQDLRHRREVAIKVLHPAIAAAIGPDRFLREIEIAAGLTHPAIVALLDSGEADGLLYYVMPLVHGSSLRDRLRNGGELPVDEAVAILRDVVDALAFAHRHGIVHRDIKPENVLLTGSRAQLADFGVAKAVDAAGGDARLTGTGVAIGTPEYMAPEQAAADPQIDHRADLYAVGVLGYEMLTGAPPFAGLAPQQILVAHLTRTVDPLDLVRPSVPSSLAAAIMRCLAKRPADRWQSAEELLRRLTPESVSGPYLARVERSVVTGSLPITEALCRRIARASFDPRMIGDRLSYLDNQAPSDVLVLMLDRWGLGPSSNPGLLESSPFRTVVPTLFGFDGGRKVRFPLGVPDHLVLLEALVADLAARTQPRAVVLVGFSAGADLMVRLAAGAAPDTRIDGCLALGMNLGIETCFASGVLAEVESAAPAVMLPALNAALGAASTVGDWVNIADYLIQIVRTFGADWGPVRAFARGIVEPWVGTGVEPFCRWYREATDAGRRVRCVFEDNARYRDTVRDIQLRNLDHGILGPNYRPGSIVVEPVAGHFDLVEPECLIRHLESFVAEVIA